MADPSRCRSCGADIDWVRTRSGKAMPCDPTPIAIIPVSPGLKLRAHTVIAGIDDAGNMVRGIEASEGTPPTVIVHVRVSHFSSCPEAEQHRRERSRG